MKALRPAPPPPGICMESWQAIKLGMTEEEVEAIMGCPPGDYSTGPCRVGQVGIPGFCIAPHKVTVVDEWKSWHTDKLYFTFGFREGRLVRQDFLPVTRVHFSLIEELSYQFDCCFSY
jgi:hypothetical protein